MKKKKEPVNYEIIFLTTKKTILGTKKISQVKATFGAIPNSTILKKISHSHNLL